MTTNQSEQTTTGLQISTNVQQQYLDRIAKDPELFKKLLEESKTSALIIGELLQVESIQAAKALEAKQKQEQQTKELEAQRTKDIAEIAQSLESDWPAQWLNHDINMEHDGVKVYQNLINFKSTLPKKLAQLPSFLERINKLKIIERMQAEQINLDYTDGDISSGRVMIGQGMVDGVDKWVSWIPYRKDGWDINQVTQDRFDSIIIDLMIEFSIEIWWEQDKRRNIFNQLFVLKTGMGLWWWLSRDGKFYNVGDYGYAIIGLGDGSHRHYLNSNRSDAWQRRYYRDGYSVPAFKN